MHCRLFGRYRGCVVHPNVMDEGPFTSGISLLRWDTLEIRWLTCLAHKDRTKRITREFKLERTRRRTAYVGVFAPLARFAVNHSIQRSLTFTVVCKNYSA